MRARRHGRGTARWYHEPQSYTWDLESGARAVVRESPEGWRWAAFGPTQYLDYGLTKVPEYASGSAPDLVTAKQEARAALREGEAERVAEARKPKVS